ncbi:MAG: C25 family cysteine peptidase [bacterium]
MCRMRFAVLAAVLVFVAAAATVQAEIASFTYSVPAPELRTAGDRVYLGVEGFGSTTDLYYPVLPSKKVHYEIPFAADNVTVTVMPAGERSLGTFANYLMRQPPLPLENPTYKVPAPPERIPDVVPAEHYSYAGEQQFRGHHLVEIVLYPVRYNSVSGEATGVSSYSISVTYSMPVTDEESAAAALRGRASAFEPLASEIIENYGEANARMIEKLVPEGDSPAKADLAASPHIPGTLYDLNNPAYAIITNSTMQSYAQTLADWKTKKGVPAKVYTVSWITSNYSGYDNQEKIRNFLRLDDSTPRFQYVLLMGDTGVVPTRTAYSDADAEYVPCDYYYSDVVDGAVGATYDWDTDNDHKWGEMADDINWLPDSYVGRWAITSTTDANTLVNNVLGYEKSPPAGTWPKRIVFGSSFANFDDGYYDPTDMATVAEWVRNDFLVGTGVTYDRGYEAEGYYPSTYTRDYDLTAANFRDHVATGCGFAYPSGHGNYLGNYRTVWVDDYNHNGICDDGETTSYSLCTQSYNPATAGKKPFVYVAACLSGQFDRSETCLGDFIIANWGIGDVASSRTSYYCVGWDDPDWPWNQGQEYRFWEEIYSNGKYRMGQIHGDHKYHYVTDFNSIEGGIYGPDQDEASRKNMFSSNLFGDPELPVWTDTPTGIVVTHNATLPLGSSIYTVTVTSGGSALSGATVCLWKGTEVYLVDTTNGSGVATFTPTPSTVGTMYVTVTKHNYIPYEGSAAVASDSEAPVVAVTAPNGGETWGIGTGQTITWTATDNIGVTSITIALSRDGGATYPETLATGESNDGMFIWTVTAPPTTAARVNVIAYDAAANSGQDASNANFTIADVTAPAVTVTSPDGGEIWDIGSSYDITWTATDAIGVASISIILSDDGGLTFPDTLATGEANDGSYSWLVDRPASVTERVKVCAYDAAANKGEDTSDGDFELYDPASGVLVDRGAPTCLVLVGNTPNPSGEATAIKFGIPSAGRVDMDVFDVAGRRVANLAGGQYSAGYHRVEWRGGLGSGIYFVKVRFGGEEVTRKVVISQ